jgi:Xaa-Pro aminopeptidase
LANDTRIVEETLRTFSRRSDDSTAYIAAKRTPGVALDDTSAQIDMVKLRAYRLHRLQAQLREADCGAALLCDPINVRYATGTRNMTVWLLHNQGRYCLVPAEGRVILFEYANKNCRGLAAGIEVIEEIRPAKAWSYFFAGEHQEESCRAWADEIATVLRDVAGGNMRLAVDRLDPLGAHALEFRGLTLVDGQALCEKARAIKSVEEITCMAVAMSACEVGMARMREALRPGMTENQLWALLHQANIELGGEWIETRLLSSGGRTNPWFREASDRVIRPRDLVSFDTDLIGPFGYCSDVSRTFFCEPGRPTDEQRTLYGLALDQIHHNLELVRPGVTFREIADKAWKVPERYSTQKYSSIAHGVGLCDEWPVIAYRDVGRATQDGVLSPGMTICLESYIGEVDGAEGVKLEEQILVTDTGYQLLSTFPFEDALCS